MKTGTRGSFSTKGQEVGIDAFMEECRLLAQAADPNLAEVGPELQEQLVVSLAVQRIIEWATRQKYDGVDADVVNSQAVVGVLTGLGIGVAMLGYDAEDIIRRGQKALRTAAKGAREEFRRTRPWG
jgi:hypothetical protein